VGRCGEVVGKLWGSCGEVVGLYFRGFGTSLELSWEFGGNLVGI